MANVLSGAVLNNGATENVANAWSAINTIINSGGKEVVASGGVTSGTTVYKGGQEIIAGGAVDSGTTLKGGSEIVSQGGVAYNTLTLQGSAQISGQEIVTSGKEADNLTLYNGATANVAVGGVIFSAVVNSGANLYLGGQAYATTLNSGGAEVVSSGAYSQNATVNTGATVTVAAGGAISNETFNKNTAFTISAGSYASAVTLNAASATVLNAGNLLGLEVKSGSVETVNSGGTASATVIFNGGAEIISGGLSIGSVLSGGTETVLSGGVDSGSVLSGGSETVSQGGIAYNTQVINGSLLINGGAEIVTSGYETDNAVLSNGGTLTVSAGGTASATVVNSGSVETVSSGGSALAAVVNSGGLEVVGSGGYSQGAFINTGAKVQLQAGGVLSSAILNSGAVLTVSAGSLADSVSLISASETVSSGGVSVNALVSAGATETITSSGVDSGSTIYSGGTELVSAGGVAYNTQNLNGSVQINGGNEIVGSGFQVSNITLNNGGFETILSGGAALSTLINSGATEIISSGGYAQGSILNAGGQELLAAGAYIINDTLNSATALTVTSGSEADYLYLNNAALAVQAGGLASGSYLSGFSAETVSAGGVSLDAYLGANSTEQVSGVVSGIYVSGGAENVFSGGVDSGSLVYAGTETVSSGGTAYNTVNGAGLNAVQINGGTEIATSGNQLLNIVVNAGGADSLQGGAFAVNTQINAGGYDYIVGGATALGSVINSGGVEVVSAGGYAQSATINTGGQELISAGGVVSGDIFNAGTTLTVTSGSLAGKTILNAAGEIVLSGGVTSGSVVNTGSVETISSGGVDKGSLLNGGVEVVLSGGSAVISNKEAGLTVNAGASLLLPGVAATAVVLNAQDQLVISKNGVVVEIVTLNGSNNNKSFTLAADGHGGAVINVGSLTAVQSVAYNAANGQLSLTGANLTTLASDYQAGDITLKGDGGGSYTLSSGFTAVGTPTTANVVLQLSAADQLAVNGLLNQNGLTANDGVTAFAISATTAWDAGNAALAPQALTVNNFTPPAINNVAYNAASGVFTFSGANFSNHGAANGIAVADFTLSAGAGSYHFNANDLAGNLSAGSFSITLSAADQVLVNAIVNANGAANLYGAAYNLSAGSHWDSDGGAAIATQAVSAGNVPQPLISSVAYNAALGQLSLTGINFSAASGFNPGDLSLRGDGGSSYTLTAGSAVIGAPSAASAVIQLSAADQLAVNGLLNANGNTANDQKTAYNLSGLVNWDNDGSPFTTLAVTVNNVLAPSISGVSYNAASGVFTVTGANLDNHGSNNGIALADFKFSGGASGSYGFSAGNDSVSNLSSTGFTITLNSSDKAAVNAFVSANGTAPLTGSAYNLSAVSNWDSDSGLAITTQAVSASNVSPILSSVGYNAASGQLTLTGSNLTGTAAGYQVSDFTIKGDGGGSYTLTSGSAISGTPTANTAVIQLSSADQLAVDGLLNKAGVTANDGSTLYNLSASAGWDTGAGAISSQGLTVSNFTAPTISNVVYNAVSGVFTVSGANLDNHGSSLGIALADFKFTGGAGSYGFSAGNDSVSNLSASGFTVTLSNADKTAVNAFVNANGTAPLTGSAYNLTAIGNWDSDSGAAIATQVVSVMGVPQPVVSSVGYNAANGQLTLTGVNLTSTAAGYQVSDFSIKGDGGSSYTLTSGSAISGTPTANTAAIQLSTADQLAVDGLLNKAGAIANDGSTLYNLSASTGWDTGASAISGQGLTVSNFTPPTISNVAYNATSGVFTVSGANLDNHGSSNGIALADFKLTGGTAGSYSFSPSNDSVSNLSASGFTVTLSSADKAAVNAFVNANGTAPLTGSAYNLTAISNWDSDSGLAITAQAVNVSNVPQPVVSSVSYNAASGQLTLTGVNLTGTAVGYQVTNFSIKGDGGSSYSLTSGSAISGTPTANTAVIQLSTADQLAVDGLLNKAGAIANDGSTLYNLSASTGWDSGASAISSQGLTVSNFTAPTISNVAYNASSGVFTITGANLDNHGSSNGIALADFKLTGGAGGSYSFSASNDSVSNLSASGFTVTLSSADKTAVNAFVNANGTAPLSGSAYNLTATGNWDSDSGLAIATQSVTASGVLPQQVTAAAITLPANVASDLSGNLYVEDLNGVDKLPAGSAAHSNLLGLSGLGLGLFSSPLAADNNGDVFLGVQGVSLNGGWINFGLSELSAGSQSLKLLAPLSVPAVAVSVDQTGDVFAALSNSSIVEVAAGTNNAVTLNTGATLGAPLGLIVDTVGNLYIGQANGSIVELAAGANTLTTLVAAGSSSSYAGGSLGVDNAGDVYYLSGSGSQGWSVAEIAAGTHTLSTLDPVHTGASFLPKGVSADGHGNVYVTDMVNGNILEIVNPNPVHLVLTGVAPFH